MSTKGSVPGGSDLDIDLAGVLKDSQNVFQSLAKTRKDLRSSQLEARITKDLLQSARQRLELSDNRGIPHEWSRLSKSLSNVIKVVSSRKNVAEYEESIRKLTEENERLKKQLDCSASNHEEALKKQKSDLKKESDKEAAQYSKQISELTIDKELAASEASIKYDQLQSRIDRIRAENEERCNAIVAQYEKLVQSVSDQKHKLREENMALQRREMELRDQLDRLQNHSTDYMLGMGGRRVAPIAMGGSQRYAEVVETVPLQTYGSAKSSSQQPVQSKGNDRGVPEVAEVSSTCNRGRTQGSPQHPGLGGHVAKPRKKRKLFSHSNESC
ncbi:cingulin-like protein 1 [Armigeres subalbatus]|uniref:cingulin-like protein 1 n=1 Tax=Armigeres subalbatus TaxID=124917 RepID=UPI002ED48BEF